MANGLYTRMKQGCISGEIVLTATGAHLIKATLIDLADYTVNLATDTTYVAGANGVADVAKVAVSAGLGSPTVTGGVFDTANFSWTAVTGDPCEAIVLWDDTPTTPVADPLLAFYDTGITGMPVTPNGGDINVTVNGSGWFAL